MVSVQWIWWIGVGVLAVAELMTGTFYLLMIALGFAAGAIVDLAGGALHLQIAAAAIVSLVLLIALRRSGFGRRQKRDVSTNPDVNLDIGATVIVAQWQNRRARVPYRGADWDVALADGEPEDQRVYEVRAVRGNCLIVAAKSAG